MSRRLSVVVGFYRVCVIDHVLTQSPADYVRRSLVPPESPTLGLGHLQFETLLTTARLSANINDFALIAMLGLLGLRIFEATGANIADLGEEHGHRVLRVRGKGGLAFPPGAGYRYSNSGYNVLGEIVTRVSGRRAATTSASTSSAPPE